MKGTKEKLLQTAAKMFAMYGINGVSTRDLVKTSGVNLCSINYYFGSKQKLYEAVMEEVLSKLQKNVIEAVKSLSSQSVLSPKEEIKLIIDKLFDFFCSDIVSDVQAELLLREIFNPTCVYDKFYSDIFEPMHKHVSELIAEIWDVPSSSKQVILQTHMLFGQVMIFRIHREALRRRLPEKKYTPEILRQIKQQLEQNCETILAAGESK